MVSKLLTLVLLVGLLAFMITQVIWPAFTGTPFFTAFRKDTYGKKWRKHKNAVTKRNFEKSIKEDQ